MAEERQQVCDRCGKKFKIPNDVKKVVVGTMPSRVSIKELGGKNALSYLLCPQCTEYVKNYIAIFAKNQKRRNQNGN